MCFQHEEISLHRTRTIHEVDSRGCSRHRTKNTLVRTLQWTIPTLEHICRYKSAMRLATNNEVVLCKTFTSTLSDKHLHGLLYWNQVQSMDGLSWKSNSRKAIRFKKGVTLANLNPKEDILPFEIHGTWKAMEECQKLGLVKSIGVSNYTLEKLQILLEKATIRPAVNQVCIFSWLFL